MWPPSSWYIGQTVDGSSAPIISKLPMFSNPILSQTEDLSDHRGLEEMTEEEEGEDGTAALNKWKEKNHVDDPNELDFDLLNSDLLGTLDRFEEDGR
jgi:hypothetical protein